MDKACKIKCYAVCNVWLVPLLASFLSFSSQLVSDSENHDAAIMWRLAPKFCRQTAKRDGRGESLSQASLNPFRVSSKSFCRQAGNVQ